MSVTTAATRRFVFLLCAVVAIVAPPSAAFAAPAGAPLGAASGATALASPINGSVVTGSWNRQFTIDTNLLSPSHLSAWQIDQYLAEYTPLPPLGHAFKAAEANYGVNALYLLAHAMHETDFGTSYIAQAYKNLFGWTAYDSNPLAFAARFPSFAAGIDYVASQISTEYLSPWGRFYGGAPTLRGMHMYATDPQWGPLIAAIANSMLFPSLNGQLVRFSTPATSGPILGGRPTTVTAEVTSATGRLPDGLRIAARFRPISIVEANAPAAKQPDADPPFTPVDGSTQNGRIVARVVAPSIPGRYELDLQVRDSDGTPLNDGSRFAVPGLITRVFGADAVTYSVTQSVSGLSIAVTNVGRATIPALGGVPLDASAIGVWALPDAGPATLLAQLPLGADLAAGATWAGELPAATLSAAVPGVIMVRLEVAGADDRAAGSPPGVFRLSLAPFLVAAPADTAAGPTAGPTAAPADDSTSIGDGAQPGPGASAGTTTGTGASGAEQAALPSPGPTAPAAGQGAGPAPSPVPAVNVTIQPVTPADPGTDALLGRPLPPVTVHPAATVQAAPSPSGGSSPTPTSSGVVAGLLAPIGPPAPSAGPAPTAAPELTYALQFAISVAPDGGVATVRVTNIGTGTIHSAGPVTNTPGTGTAPAQLTAALMVKAVPASGSAAGPLQLLVPLTSDLAPGATTNLAVRLPSLPQLRVSYLVSAQVVPAIPGETLTSSSTLFWMRGPVAAPIAVAATTAAVAGSAAGIGGSPAPGQAVVAVTTLAGTTATPASAVAWSSSAGPSAPSSATASSAAPFAGPSTPPAGSSSSAPSTPSAASDAGSVPYAATIIGHAMRQRADPRTR